MTYNRPLSLHLGVKKRTRGPALRATPEWKEAVREKLADLKWSHQQLADRLGIGRTTITVALLDTTNRSRAVALVCDLWGWPYPEVEIADPDMAEAVALLESLPAEERSAWIALLRARVKR